MRVRLHHITRYDYDDGVSLGPHTIRLAPAPHLASRVLTYNLQITPDARVQWQHDAWANSVAKVTFPDRNDIRSLEIRVDASLELTPVNPFDFTLDERVRELPFTYPDGLDDELAPWLRQDDTDPLVHAWADDHPPRGYVIDWLVELNRRVAADVRYVIRNEPGLRTPAQTLTLREGSCRDSAWLLVHALRHAGLAARFVSGWLIQLEDEGNLPGVPRGLDRDVIDLHAWAEVYLPGAGWVGLDGTSGLFCTEGHIPLATAVVPSLAAPITGTASGAADRFDFDMHVERIGHVPSPRRPYTDDAWERLLASGREVDARLERAGVRLTCGGEPTWSSRLDPNDPAWRTEALGDTKWTQGLALADAIRDRVAEGGIVLRRSGKHYPGESLPRWALDVLWRVDGQPIWQNRARLASSALVGTAPGAPLPAPTSTSGATHEDARRVASSLTATLDLGVEPLEAWEDPWVAITSEAMLPTDVDPLVADPDDPEARQRLAAQLTRGLGAPTGFAIPIQWQQSHWRSQRWSFRRERLYLVPGDSPMGLRLPLDRLAGTPAFFAEANPWADDGPLAGPLPEPGRLVQRPPVDGAATDRSVASGEPAAIAIRTALCVQAREGIVHVFLPPVPSAEAWLALIAAVEAAAERAQCVVRLEGYGPPRDARIQSCLVTPDPGVLEVNLPVLPDLAGYASWMDLLADAAVHCGLTTETFQLDGRATGSGGGNHLTLGGEHPDTSVFLRRPHVLASLLRLAQQHPSLSYLFTGLFVGPTSQAPRVDEGRDAMLGELELALSQLERAGDPPAPWFIDRLLRNLLVDITGNTHRTEVCIDKLFNPGAQAGRLGLLEFRAFEMPPNERMAVAQMWLMRALVACVVDRPWTAPLVRWGSRLHDRWMLPFHLGEDLVDLLAWIESHGIPVDRAWFDPFLAWRFPVMGRMQCDGVELELRNALEPLPVLGEEATGATVSRYVDSSLDRVEVRVRGLVPERHVLAVNGIRVPLTPTRFEGLAVAGVRFRAWQPPHCLQPHIGLHHPLRFDVIDTWARRSIGGCAYHVWHPEGRAFDEAPLTAFEASARRAMRFTTREHQPWPAQVTEPTWHPPGQVTLDLRWSGLDRQAPWSSGDAE